MDAFTTLTARDWQLALGQPGTALTGRDDIAQCIRIILTTPKGSDPLRPEFGSDLWTYIDHPIDKAAPHLVRACWDAISTWEPRIEITRITPRLGDEPSQIVVSILWRLHGQDQESTTEVAV